LITRSPLKPEDKDKTSDDEAQKAEYRGKTRCKSVQEYFELYSGAEYEVHV
jgi:hypothetical protein